MKKNKSPMLFGNINVHDFFQNYWQKKPLFIKKAFQNFSEPLESDELAGLACEEEINARLISQTNTNPTTSWELHDGPFDEAFFHQLPNDKWALIVNDLDKLIPNTQGMLKPFHFIPEWRFEDLQACFFASSSTLGPQIERHDLFLIQGDGHKTWQVGKTNSIDPSEYQNNQNYPLLETFDVDQSIEVEKGDLLYIPANTPFQEQSENESITWSLAYRSFRQLEIVQDFTESLQEFIDPQAQIKDEVLWEQEQSYELSDDSLTQIQEVITEHLAFDRELISDWFGRYLTQPKIGQEIEALDEKFDTEDLLELLTTHNLQIERHVAARFFYRESLEDIILYAAGGIYALNKDLKKLVLFLCNHAQFSNNKLSSYLKNAEAVAFLLDLFNCGVLSFYNDHEHELE